MGSGFLRSATSALLVPRPRPGWYLPSFLNPRGGTGAEPRPTPVLKKNKQKYNYLR